MDQVPMISNIEPIAREFTRGICRDSEMPETQIEQWVNLHWQCAAAMLEAGVMDEKGRMDRRERLAPWLRSVSREIFTFVSVGNCTS